jgi:hypothetical protein
MPGWGPFHLSAENALIFTDTRGARRFDPQLPSLVSVKLHQPVEKRPPVINRLHTDTLVQPVDVSAIRVLEETGDPTLRRAAAAASPAAGAELYV